MKKKFSNQFSLPQTPAPTASEQALYKQVKDITDDLKIAFGGGLNVQDNLAMDIKSLSVNTAKEFVLGSIKFNKVVGVSVIETAKAAVTSFSTRPLTDGTMAVTMTIDPSPTSITFLLIGE